MRRAQPIALALALAAAVASACAPDVSLGGNTRDAGDPQVSVCPADFDVGDIGLSEGRYDRTLVFGGRTRAYTVYVPQRFSPCTEPSKTIFVFRDDGAFLRPLGANRSSLFLTAASDAGYLLVVPESSGVGLRDDWNAPLASPLLNSVDDVGFVRALLDAFPTRDPKRTYAVGIGQGGTFAQSLVAQEPAFAALAVAAGVLGGRRALTGTLEIPPTPVAPTSALLIHGTADAVYPYAGGAASGQYLTSFDDEVRFWRTANECQDTPTKSVAGDNGFASAESYACTGDTEVVAVTVQGAAHTWPDLPVARYLATTTTLAFFDRHTR
jgi:poly(3-hydroxybutyrate) depolymerase